MGVADNVKRRRIELGLSQQELAERMGYRSRSTIAKIESGDNEIPAKNLVRFARALETTVDCLINGVFVSGIEKPLVRSARENKRIALVLAGGEPNDNNQKIPNQFVNAEGKPIIIYALEPYQHHPLIDDIYIICSREWKTIVQAYSAQFGINKLRGIILSGETGILSVRNAVNYLQDSCQDDDVIILQESTRPLVTVETISKLLLSGDCSIICEPMKDYIQFLVDGEDKSYVERSKLFAIQSPELYRYATLVESFDEAERSNHMYTETTCAMMMYKIGKNLNFCEGNHYNMKIVRQKDIDMLTALLKNQ